MDATVTPPLPPGFTLDGPQGQLPPLPAGFTLDNADSPKKEDEGFWTKYLGAAIEPNLTLFSGAAATPISGIAGLGAGIANKIGVPGFDNVNPSDVVRRVASALTYQPGTQGGKDALSVIGAPFEKFNELTNAAGETAADLTKSPGMGATVYTALNMLPSVLPGMRTNPSNTSSIVNTLQPASRSLMRSALKPSPESVISGEADRAITTLFNEGLNATKGGGYKLQANVDSINKKVADALANSNATAQKPDVLNRLYDVMDRVERQATPQSDIKNVQSAWNDFSQHPLIPGNDIPVQLAQDIKRGTYRQIRDKYGEQGAASVEAQKAIARGLKEEIAKAVPEIGPLNARESELLNALKLVERRAAIEGNKNPVGLMPLTNNPAMAGAFLADRSALVKSLLARAINPGKGMGISDEMAMAATAPQAFGEDAKRRQAIIDALMNQQ